jgi:adhesin/invasin
MARSRGRYVLVLSTLGMLGLGVAGGVLPLGPVSVAMASDVFPAAGVISLVPAGDLVGDGHTPVTFYLMAFEPNGSPTAGLSGKISSLGGTGGNVSEVGSGVYRFTFTPNEVASTKQVELTFKGRSATRANIAKSFPVTVAAPASHTIEIAMNPAAIVLGQDQTATLTITLTPRNIVPADVSLQATASSGEIANLTYLGDGRYTALFTPPKVNYPQVVLVNVIDRNDPSHSFATTAIPLSGRTNFPVDAPANARVVMRVGDREFGPVAADANGKANIPITVPPGVEKATVLVASNNEQPKQDTLDLRVPETRRIALLPVEAGIPLDASIRVPVRVAVVTPGGLPTDQAKVNLTASVGSVTTPVFEAKGIWRSEYTPPTGGGETRVTFVASIASASAQQTDKVDVALVPARPANLTLTTDPPRLPPGATGFKIFAKAVGPDGVGLSGRTVLFGAAGAKLRDLKDMRGGDYVATFDTSGNTAVDVSAVLQSPPSGNAFSRLLVFPTSQRLVNDGLSSSMLTIVSVDRFGYPVANVPVSLKVVEGDGNLQTSVVTNSSGIAQAYYTAGRSPGIAQIEVHSGSRMAGVALLQAPPDVVASLKIPRSGSEADLKLNDAWSAIVRTLRVEREGSGGATVAAAPVAAPDVHAGVLASLSTVAEPNTVAPGGTVTLKIKAVDARGTGVAGQKFDFVASSGTIGAVTDLGNGEYRAALTVPAGVSGEVKVSIVGGDGAAMSYIKVPVSAQAGAVWSAAPASAPVAAPQPAPVAPPPVAPAPAVASRPAPVPSAATGQLGNHRWLRIRATAGVAGYHYDYALEASPLPLDFDNNGMVDDPHDPIPYNRSLELSGSSASTDGTTNPSALLVPAIDARVDGWLPMFPYIGFEARYRFMSFGVQTDSFTQQHEGVDMTWIDHYANGTVRARYFFDSGDNRFWLGLQGGLVYTAIPIVTNWWPPDDTQGLWFFPWGFVSLTGGAQAGAEIGQKLDVLLGASLGTEAYSGIFANDFDAEVSYEIVNHLALSLAFNYLSRDVVIPHGSSADAVPMIEVTDSRAGVTLGVGAAF